MAFIGVDHPYYQIILFIIFSIIISLLFVIQLIYIQKLKILPIYLLPLLSFCMTYENVILSKGTRINDNSNEAKACFVFHSLQIPLFVIILHEMAYNLHKVRCAHFLAIPFDEGPNRTKYGAPIQLWIIRLVAIILFILNILSDFTIVHHLSEDGYSNGGFIYLSKHKRSPVLWLHFIPIIFLSAISIIIGIVLYRYGRNLTFAKSTDRWWMLPIIGAFGFTVCNIPNRNVYSWTSNLGELVLLLTTTLLVREIQNDLVLAGSYADFLHKSNIAFHSVDHKPNLILNSNSGDSSIYIEKIIEKEDKNSYELAVRSGAIYTESNDDNKASKQNDSTIETIIKNEEINENKSISDLPEILAL